MLWAGARQRDYGIERGPTGEPTRKSAPIAYAFQLPDGKCYLDNETMGSSPMLIRENEGGAHYGEPRIRVGAPPKGGFGGRHEIACDAIPQAKGGVHEPFAAQGASR